MRNSARLFITSLFIVLLAAAASMTAIADDQAMFRVRIENISSPDGQTASNGSKWPFALSPGLWLAHKGNAPLFTTGEKNRGNGLEAQAEDGNPAPLAKSLEGRKDVLSSGVFDTPVGAAAPGPATPGGAFEFTFTAELGTNLTFTMMFGQSNDLFYAPKDEGIALFDENGKPIGGDITRKITLWDAGTEINQEPGIGHDQAPRQSATNTGADEGGVIQTINKVKDGFTYPKTADVIRVTITPDVSSQSSKR